MIPIDNILLSMAVGLTVTACVLAPIGFYHLGKFTSSIKPGGRRH